MSWWKMRILMAAKDDKGGSGGGAGDDDDNGGGAPFTAEQEKALGRMVNSALTSHMGRKPFKDAIAAAVGEHTSPILAKLEEMSGSGEGGGNGGNGNGQGGNGNGGGSAKLPPEVQRQLDEQAKLIKRLQGENETSKAESARVKKQNETAEEKAALGRALKAGGLPEERIAGAVALLYHEQGKVKRDGDGRVRYQLAREGYTDDVDVETGIAEWLKSSEGKSYLPPVNVQGGGARGGSGGGSRGKAEPTETELLGELGNLLNGGKPTITLG